MKKLWTFMKAASRFSVKLIQVDLVGILSIGILSGLSIPSPVIGQIQAPLQGPIIGPALKVAIKPTIQKTFTRAPIPFKPFTLQELNLKDPKTGLPATNNTLITLPLFPLPKYPATKTTQGNPYKPYVPTKPRVMLAGDIVKELNVLEPQFNRLGYTLRDRTTIVKIGELVANRALLNDQKKRFLERKGEDAKIGGIVKYTALQPQYFSLQGIFNKESVGSIDFQTNPDKSTGIKNFVPYQNGEYRNFQGGDPDIFQITLNTGYTLSGDQTRMQFNGMGKIDVSLFGLYVDLFSLNTNWMVPTRDTNANSSTVTRLTVLGLDASPLLAGMGLNDTSQLINIPLMKWSKSVEAHTETTIQVGYVPVTFRAGIGGDVGLSTQMTLSSANASMTLRAIPYADTYIWGEAGVGGYGIADVGIGGELTLLLYSLIFDAGFSANKDTAGAVSTFQVGFSGTIDIHELAGSLFIYLDVGGKQFRYDVFQWDGLHAQEPLFNYPLQTYYPWKDKILTVQLKDITRGNEGGVCPANTTLVSRDGQAVWVQVWERGSWPDFNKIDDIVDIKDGYLYRNGVVAGLLWSPYLSSAAFNLLVASLNIPVASSQSPYLVRIALTESDICVPVGVSLSGYFDGVVDIAPAGKKVLMLEYDGTNHQFKGWTGVGSPPPYLPDYTARGTIVSPYTDNPSRISFTLRDGLMR